MSLVLFTAEAGQGDAVAFPVLSLRLSLSCLRFGLTPIRLLYETLRLGGLGGITESMYFHKDEDGTNAEPWAPATDCEVML